MWQIPTLSQYRACHFSLSGSSLGDDCVHMHFHAPDVALGGRFITLRADNGALVHETAYNNLSNLKVTDKDRMVMISDGRVSLCKLADSAVLSN